MLDQIATPPNLDTGILWIFLSLGTSTNPSFFEKAIIHGTINTPNMYEITAPIIWACDNFIKMVFLLIIDTMDI